MKTLFLMIFMMLLSLAPARAAENHADTRIDYWSASEGPWSAVWEGNGFRHTRLDGSGEVRHSANLDYETWDHGRWSVTWDQSTNQFRHENLNNHEVRFSNRIDYIASDKSKWTAIRNGPTSFYHIFVAGPDSDNSDIFGKVIKFYNENREKIEIVIEATTILAGI